MILSDRLFSLWLLPSIIAGVALVSGCSGTDSHLRNRIVVKINDASLTAEDFSDELMSRLKSFNLLSAKDSAVVSNAKSAVVQNFIVRVVTEDWARSKQLFVRKEMLDEEIKKIRGNYPDEIVFRKSLADNGLSFDVWQERLKYTLLERLVLEEIRKQIPPPKDDEAKSYFQKNKIQFQQTTAVKLRQVVLENEANAKRILQSLKQGQSLSSLAQKFSITSEAKLGGEVGWIEKGYLPAFDNAFRMGVGQKSAIYKSPFGYHIFEVIAKRASKSLTLEESRSKINKILLAEKEQVLYSDWLEKQILNARVFKDDDFIQKIQVHTRSVQ